MEQILPFTPELIALALLAGFLAGLVKGAVGFGMPMIMMSILTFGFAPEIALAVLVMPTLLSNGHQALRQGIPAAIETTMRFRWFLIIGGVCLLASAQLVNWISGPDLLLMIGIVVTAFAIYQLVGPRLRIPENSTKVEVTAGIIAGSIGGFSGIWGPPTVAYLTAVNTPKDAQMRIQGVIYGLGAVALLGAHIVSGIITVATVPLSLLACVPTMLGVAIGFRWQKKLPQSSFRKVTLIVLVIGGLNLIRRGLIG